MMSFVLAVLAAVAIFQGVDAQCYNCTLITAGGASVGPAGCGEPFDSTGIQTVPCSTKCSTLTSNSVASEGVPAIVVILRTCHDPNTQGGAPCIDFNNVEAANGTTVSQTCCTGALCNGGPESPATTPSSAGFLTFSAALAVFAPLSALIF